MRCTALALALCLSSVLDTEAQAAGTEPSRIRMPAGPGSIEGLGRDFVPSLASGTAAYGLDISVPPAVGAFGPRLSLDYDSGAGLGELGVGWRLSGVPSIRRRTVDGLPRFDDSDALELSGIGAPCALLEVERGTFRPQLESGAFVRVQRSTDGSVWEARDKRGITHRFGGGPGFVEAEGGDVATFLLREQLDLHGHVIRYTWDTRGGRGWLTRVVWNEVGAQAQNELVFGYEPLPHPQRSFAAGIAQVLDRRIRTIDVTHGGQLVRRYQLGYGEGSPSRLTRVELLGTDGVTPFPPLSFEYSEAQLASTGALVAMASPPGRSPSDANTALADLDGDGLPDLLDTAPGQFRTYLNRDGHSWLPPRDWDPGESPSVELSATGVQLADLDGDSAIDLVVKSGLASLRYFPGLGATRFGTPIALSTVPSFSFEDPDLRLADMDGDRRSDAVITTAAGLAIAYNIDGRQWREPQMIGPVDGRQALRFSDGRTQLCDVNGDRIEDLCTLRSQSLVFWLGRGRGRFEPAQVARGVPTFEDGTRWQLHDLDGDGWLDLVHVGVQRIEYALAIGLGELGPVQSIDGTPELGPTGTLRFADMNGSGTTDIVWIDVSGSPDRAWQYLELFPAGKAGLLTRVDNGLGKTVRMTYGSAARQAAQARAAGDPWTTRINVAMPVVERIEIDDGLGSPRLVRELSYRNGTWDPVERTLAGFGQGSERQLGDAHTPTLVEETTFDTGLVERTLRGAPLVRLTRDEDGRIFQRTTTTYGRRLLATVGDGRSILYTPRASTRVEVIEGDLAAVRTSLTEWTEDDFGNVVIERRWGEVVGGDPRAGHDESFVVRSYAQDPESWIIGRLASEEVQDADGVRVSATRQYYDGAEQLGQVTRGDVTRSEAWAGPGPDSDAEGWQLDTATTYDRDGNPIETRGPLGGGRRFTWSEADRTSIASESVLLDGRTLTETAIVDPRFGNLLAVIGYDGQRTSFAYDVFGRLTEVQRPGDPEGSWSVRYRYLHGAPLSRIVTERRLWIGEDALDVTEDLVDGLGRKRGALTRDEGQRWVLAGVGLLDARGQTRRTLRARFVGEAEHEQPPLLTDGPGVESWRDATGRVVATRSEMGLENRTAYAPWSVRTWDGAQSDPSSPYEHTPTVIDRDGLGRVVRRSETLAGRLLSVEAAYDAAGRLVERVDPERHRATYGYDGRGRRVLSRDPDAGERRQRYDAVGNLIEIVRPDGVVQRLTYDLAGRVLTEDWNSDGQPEVVNTWDIGGPNTLGKLVAVQDPGGRVEHEYDARGLTVVSHHTIDGHTHTVGRRYDAQDRQYLHVYPDGSSVRLYRNARGQVARYGDALSFEYDGDGLELRRVFNTGVSETWSYDGDRRVVGRATTAADGRPLVDLAWSYDGAGNVVELIDRRPGISPQLDRSERYTHDNLYRLRSARGTWGELRWTFSDSGNLLERSGTVGAAQALDLRYGEGAGPHALTHIGARALRYDAAGRLTDDGERSYTWDDDDRLIAVATRGGSVVESRFDVTGQRTLRMERDALGRESRTTFIDAWSEVKDGTLVRYLVHGGQRVARLSPTNGTVPAVTTSSAGLLALWLLVGLALSWLMLTLLAFTCANPARGLRPRTLALALLLCAHCDCDCSDPVPPIPVDRGTVEVLGPDDQLLFSDLVGSLTEQTSGVGEPIGAFASLPFGLSRYDTSSETRRFANSPRDTSVGLDSMGPRFFAADLGVWTSPDPAIVDEPERALEAGFAASNPYAYAGLMPIVASDESGEWLHIVAGGLIGGAIGAGTELYKQYSANGTLQGVDLGRVGAKAAAGAVIGAVSALAGPQAGLGTAVAMGAGTGAAGGVAERLIDSGGRDAGTLADLAGDTLGGAITGGAFYGAGKLLTKATGLLKRAVCECGACFAAGTLVLTADGPRPIETLAVGDWVLSREEASGETALRPITDVFVTEGKEVFELELEDGEVLSVTRDHPFWVEGRGWTEAIELRAGDRLGGSGAVVREKRAGRSEDAVYNLGVAELHTYFVGSGGSWVHNTCPIGAGTRPSTLKPGPHAKESIPAHTGRPTASEQRQVNELMKKHGCHTCGTKNPGTKSGNAIADHQPPQALGEPKIFLPHCNHCKAQQGGDVLQALRKGGGP